MQPQYYLSEMVAEPNLKIFSVIQNYVINTIKFINPNCFCLFNTSMEQGGKNRTACKKFGLMVTVSYYEKYLQHCMILTFQ